MGRFQLSPPGLNSGFDPLKAFADTYEQKRLEQKFLTEQAQKREQEEFNRAKGTVASLISSYNSAQSQGLKEDVAATMKQYYGALGPNLRKAVQPYIMHSPISPMAEKKRLWLEHHPRPEPLGLPQEGWPESMKEILIRDHMQKQFEISDWERGLETFLFGAQSAKPKENMIPLQTGGAYVRTDSGQVMYMSDKDMGLEALEEKTGIDKKTIYLTGGKPAIPGDESVVISNGQKVTYQGYTNLLEADPKKRYFRRQKSVAAAPKRTVPMPAPLNKILLDWIAKEPKDERVMEWRKLAAKEPKRVSAELSRAFPGWSFRVLAPGKPGWIEKYLLDNIPVIGWAFDPDGKYTSALIPIPGTPYPLADMTGTEYTFYYNTDRNAMYDGVGNNRGDFAQATEWAAARKYDPATKTFKLPKAKGEK